MNKPIVYVYSQDNLTKDNATCFRLALAELSKKFEYRVLYHAHIEKDKTTAKLLKEGAFSTKEQ